MSIGERIQSLRKDRNISQARLASMLEVSRQAVSKWENGQTIPDMLNLIQLADILDTDVEYLATGSHSKLPSSASASPNKETQIVEKIVEKPVLIEKTVEVEKIVEVEKVVETVVEKPVIRKVVRKKFIRNPIEFLALGLICFVAGLIIGLLI